MAHDQDQDMANNTTSTLPSRPATNSTSQSNPSKPTGEKEDTKMTSDDASESNSDDESSSEAESSSDDDSTSDEDDDTEIPTLKPGVKPDFSSARKLTAGAPSLQDRLKAFLPQLAEANSKLAQPGSANAFSMEDVKEDEPHIEMDLGLGVLEEKREGEESEDEDDDEGMNGEEKERKRKEKDVMSELMGRKGESTSTKGIQEVE